jgi:hypothetical protein
MVAINRTAGQNQNAELAKSARGLKFLKERIGRVAGIDLMPDRTCARVFEIVAENAFRKAQSQGATAATLGPWIVHGNTTDM